MLKITVDLDPPYTAVIDRGGVAHIGTLARKYLPEGARAVVVTTPNVRRHWGSKLEASLKASAIPSTTLEMPDGEEHKHLAALETLAEAMSASGAARDALVIAFGGGMVGDVAALLASLYMRGVNLIQVPTSLVAMVDSALGGKTAVNLRAGKNLIGSYHHPRAILVDPEVLSTLPEREYRSGLAEAIKYGIIRDRALFEQMESQAAGIIHRNPRTLEPLIARCLEHKAEVVALDERESGLRQILNFGHTLGHALEAATEYKVHLHGEAVAWGMMAAGALAVELKRFECDQARRMNATILELCAPLPPMKVGADALLRHIARDKKVRGGIPHFILPNAIGAVDIVKGVPEAAIRRAIATVSNG